MTLAARGGKSKYLVKLQSSTVQTVHVESWRGFRQSLNWMALKHFLNTNRAPPKLPEGRLGEVTNKADCLVELMKPKVLLEEIDAGLVDILSLGPAEFHNTYDTEPIGWFSSLWTLQEAVLCPSTHLYIRSGERLEDDAGYALGLSTIFVIIAGFEIHCEADEPAEMTFSDPCEYELEISKRTPHEALRLVVAWPRGPQKLRKFRKATHLEHIPHTLGKLDER
jgi:hypothetical protein